MFLLHLVTSWPCFQPLEVPIHSLPLEFLPISCRHDVPPEVNKPDRCARSIESLRPLPSFVLFLISLFLAINKSSRHVKSCDRHFLDGRQGLGQQFQTRGMSSLCAGHRLPRSYAATSGVGACLHAASLTQHYQEPTV